MNGKLNDILKQLLERCAVSMDASVCGAAACEVPSGFFSDAGKILKAAGFRLAAEWASDETLFGRGFGVYAAYIEGRDHIVIKSLLPPDDPAFPTLTRHFPAAYRMERQIASLMGLKPDGHPDPRPWIRHEDWPEGVFPLRKSFDGTKPLGRVEGTYRWVSAEGEGVFEIPVGPVHAGIIEPGHFRFQAVGEDIINLEEKLGYVHKGIEKRFEALGWEEAARLAARVSGDSTVAHAIAFCMAVEAASGCVPPPRAGHLRAIMLERERITNHLGDIGAICNDIAFTFLHCQFATLRERVLRTNRKVFGHRLMMDGIALGGVAADLSDDAFVAIIDDLHVLSIEFERLVRIYEDNPSVEDRIYGAGVLEPDAAKALGVVGFTARASGQRLDARIENPFPPYDKFPPTVPALSSGDVHARAWVRVEEVRESSRLIRELIREMPEGSVRAGWSGPLSGLSGFSVVEGWRGEIIYWVQCAPGGGINRCMVRDPSTMNWVALEQAVKGNIVPDFPLCNKSFNQSYSGHDL
ncbi:MAG: NADH-quinone oxidoreductase subunit C [Deltaproteobacteria bacterium]|nr:NADH-quinone oxidoreductase subunit C [Deltaproteobacteria bacterium]MCL4874727.1 NADH-quinone oxidoreductase subunit C [bacterium]